MSVSTQDQDLSVGALRSLLLFWRVWFFTQGEGRGVSGFEVNEISEEPMKIFFALSFCQSPILCAWFLRYKGDLKVDHDSKIKPFIYWLSV